MFISLCLKTWLLSESIKVKTSSITNEHAQQFLQQGAFIFTHFHKNVLPSWLNKREKAVERSLSVAWLKINLPSSSHTERGGRKIGCGRSVVWSASETLLSVNFGAISCTKSQRTNHRATAKSPLQNSSGCAEAALESILIDDSC